MRHDTHRRRPHDQRQSLPESIGKKERRKMAARREGHDSLWFGLGMFGLIGWSVAIPTVLGVAAGVWIDSRWPSRFSWTLMLLFIGVVLGCLNAWYWLRQEGGGRLQDRQENRRA